MWKECEIVRIEISDYNDIKFEIHEGKLQYRKGEGQIFYVLLNETPKEGDIVYCEAEDGCYEIATYPNYNKEYYPSCKRIVACSRDITEYQQVYYSKGYKFDIIRNHVLLIPWEILKWYAEIYNAGDEYTVEETFTYFRTVLVKFDDKNEAVQSDRDPNDACIALIAKE